MYVLVGANGNITSKAARLLLAQGQGVRVVGRNARRLEPLRQAGADLAIGDVADAGFLTEAFGGAQAVYTMLPPNYAATDPLAEYARIGEAIAQAIGASGITRVVNLSSTGAHVPAGTGPIAALHAQERRLDALAGVRTLHLRPGYFYENHLGAIATIQAVGVYADLTDSDVPIPSVATTDIAAVVVRELLRPRLDGGHRVLHLRGPRLYTQAEAAALLGRAIGRPELQHVKADAAQVKAAMRQQGISPAMADLFEQMSRAFGWPEFVAGIEAGPTEITPTSIEQFAPIFAATYAAAMREGRLDEATPA
jgi:uncharacterized protein YbjT (DUF2867 family)